LFPVREIIKNNPDLFTFNYIYKELQFYNLSLYNLCCWEYR